MLLLALRVKFRSHHSIATRLHFLNLSGNKVSVKQYSVENAARHFSVFPPGRGPPTPQKLESIFRHFFAALNLAEIDTVI